MFSALGRWSWALPGEEGVGNKSVLVQVETMAVGAGHVLGALLAESCPCFHCGSRLGGRQWPNTQPEGCLPWDAALRAPGTEWGHSSAVAAVPCVTVTSGQKAWPPCLVPAHSSGHGDQGMDVATLYSRARCDRAETLPVE